MTDTELFEKWFKEAVTELLGEESKVFVSPNIKRLQGNMRGAFKAACEMKNMVIAERDKRIQELESLLASEIEKHNKDNDQKDEIIKKLKTGINFYAANTDSTLIEEINKGSKIGLGTKARAILKSL